MVTAPTEGAAIRTTTVTIITITKAEVVITVAVAAAVIRITLRTRRTTISTNSRGCVRIRITGIIMLLIVVGKKRVDKNRIMPVVVDMDEEAAGGKVAVEAVVVKDAAVAVFRKEVVGKAAEGADMEVPSSGRERSHGKKS